ncbi:Mitochondrial outer membrane protein iml2 [Arthrobotrys musiformis]|uniref:Mitochondrial outer membrane protein iml2 n=1 Tax=Arthrobotrys musiformis TaxID=47236 RepID=A0AAV9WMC5_9PEZI
MRATSPGAAQSLVNFVYPLIKNMPGIRSLTTLSIVTLTFLIIVTSSILSFTSTILLSDVIIQPVPSGSRDFNVTMDYIWRNNTSYGVPEEWERLEGADQYNTTLYENRDFRYSPVQGNLYWRTGTTNFPAFAEYSLDPPVVEGLVDTGTTIRAFLPFLKAEDRSKVREYIGKAVLFDARVVCQKPEVSNFQVYKEKGTIVAIRGNVRKTISSDMIQSAQPEESSFFCGIDVSRVTDSISICQLPNSDIGNLGMDRSQAQNSDYHYWDAPPPENITFPPLSYGGGLKSEFSTADRKTRNGGAYLILDRKNGYDPLADIVDGVVADREFFLKNPEWGEVGTSPPEDFRATTFSDVVYIGTLCYTPLDAVDRNVEISRIRSQSETELATYLISKVNTSWFGPGFDENRQWNAEEYDVALGGYSFDKTLPLFLPGSPESRGAFTLKPLERPWARPESANFSSDGPWLSRTNLTRPKQLHPIVDALHLKHNKPQISRPGQENYDIYGNFSIALNKYFRNYEVIYGLDSFMIGGGNWQGDLFNAVRNHSDGNVALALQAILTVVASNAYYASLPEFTRYEIVSLNVFQNVSSPGGPYGTRRGGKYSQEQQGLFSTYVKGRLPIGFTIIAVVVGLQIILSAIIVVRFLQETTLTRIGDPWQAVAQVAADTDEFGDLFTILELSKRVDTDREAVAKEMKILGVDEKLVGVRQRHQSAKLTERTRRTLVPNA